MKSNIIVIFIIFLSACSSEPNTIPYTNQVSEEKPQNIWIVSHGWHTGFVIPAQQIQKQIPKLKERFGTTTYLELGWGDRGFYQAKEITTGLTLNALFWPTETVIHVVAVPATAEKYFTQSQVKKICLKESQYASLIQFIAQSFKKNTANQIIPLNNGIYGNSQFYQSYGDFYFFNTCNKWTAKGLKSAGLDISTTFKLTAESIMDYSTSQSPCSIPYSALK